MDQGKAPSGEDLRTFIPLTSTGAVEEVLLTQEQLLKGLEFYFNDQSWKEFDSIANVLVESLDILTQTAAETEVAPELPVFEPRDAPAEESEEEQPPSPPRRPIIRKDFRVKRKKWGDEDHAEFERLFNIYGKNYATIAANMTGVTRHQVRSHAVKWMQKRARMDEPSPKPPTPSNPEASFDSVFLNWARTEE